MSDAIMSGYPKRIYDLGDVFGPRQKNVSSSKNIGLPIVKLEDIYHTLTIDQKNKLENLKRNDNNESDLQSESSRCEEVKIKRTFSTDSWDSSFLSSQPLDTKSNVHYNISSDNSLCTDDSIEKKIDNRLYKKYHKIKSGKFKIKKEKKSLTQMNTGVGGTSSGGGVIEGDLSAVTIAAAAGEGEAAAAAESFNDEKKIKKPIKRRRKKPEKAREIKSVKPTTTVKKAERINWKLAGENLEKNLQNELMEEEKEEEEKDKKKMMNENKTGRSVRISTQRSTKVSMTTVMPKGDYWQSSQSSSSSSKSQAGPGPIAYIDKDSTLRPIRPKSPIGPPLNVCQVKVHGQIQKFNILSKTQADKRGWITPLNDEKKPDGRRKNAAKKNAVIKRKKQLGLTSRKKPGPKPRVKIDDEEPKKRRRKSTKGIAVQVKKKEPIKVPIQRSCSCENAGCSEDICVNRSDDPGVGLSLPSIAELTQTNNETIKLMEIPTNGFSGNNIVVSMQVGSLEGMETVDLRPKPKIKTVEKLANDTVDFAAIKSRRIPKLSDRQQVQEEPDSTSFGIKSTLPSRASLNPRKKTTTNGDINGRLSQSVKTITKNTEISPFVSSSSSQYPDKTTKNKINMDNVRRQLMAETLTKETIEKWAKDVFNNQNENQKENGENNYLDDSDRASFDDDKLSTCTVDLERLSCELVDKYQKKTNNLTGQKGKNNNSKKSSSPEKKSSKKRKYSPIRFDEPDKKIIVTDAREKLRIKRDNLQIKKDISDVERKVDNAGQSSLEKSILLTRKMSLVLEKTVTKSHVEEKNIADEQKNLLTSENEEKQDNGYEKLIESRKREREEEDDDDDDDNDELPGASKRFKYDRRRHSETSSDSSRLTNPRFLRRSSLRSSSQNSMKTLNNNEEENLKIVDDKNEEKDDDLSIIINEIPADLTEEYEKPLGDNVKNQEASDFHQDSSSSSSSSSSSNCSYKSESTEKLSEISSRPASPASELNEQPNDDKNSIKSMQTYMTTTEIISKEKEDDDDDDDGLILFAGEYDEVESDDELKKKEEEKIEKLPIKERLGVKKINSSPPVSVESTANYENMHIDNFQHYKSQNNREFEEQFKQFEAQSTLTTVPPPPRRSNIINVIQQNNVNYSVLENEIGSTVPMVNNLLNTNDNNIDKNQQKKRYFPQEIMRRFNGYCFGMLQDARCPNNLSRCRFQHVLRPKDENINDELPHIIKSTIEYTIYRGWHYYLVQIFERSIRQLDKNSIIDIYNNIMYKFTNEDKQSTKQFLGPVVIELAERKMPPIDIVMKLIKTILPGDIYRPRVIIRKLIGYIKPGYYWLTLRELLLMLPHTPGEIIVPILMECVQGKVSNDHVLLDVQENMVKKTPEPVLSNLDQRILRVWGQLIQRVEERIPVVNKIKSRGCCNNHDTQEIDRASIESPDSSVPTTISQADKPQLPVNVKERLGKIQLNHSDDEQQDQTNDNFKLVPIDYVSRPTSIYQDQLFKFHKNLQSIKVALMKRDYECIINILNNSKIKYLEVPLARGFHAILCKEIMTANHHIEELIKISGNKFFRQTDTTLDIYEMIF